MLLIRLLNDFSTKEMTRFTAFVISPYHNTDEYLSPLLQALKIHAIGKKIRQDYTPLYSNMYQFCMSSPLKESALRPDQTKWIHTKVSALTRLAEQFLTIEALKDKEDQRSALLYYKLGQKKQFHLYMRQLKKDRKKLETQATKGLDYYNYAYEIENGLFHYLEEKGSLQKENNLEALVYNLDLQYLLERLKAHNTMVSLSRINNQVKFDFQPMEAINALLNLPIYAQHPLIKIYKVIIFLLQKKEKTSYEKLLELLQKYASFLEKEDLHDFYIVACNFCIHNIIKGNLTYREELSALYKRMDSQDILTPKGQIDVAKLKNIIVLACQLRDFKWATTLTKKYQLSVEKKYQQSIYHFNMGIIAFYQKKYKTAINHCIRVEKINLSYDLDSRIILLKAHYQLDTEYDERSLQIFRSAATFIANHKVLPTFHKKGYKNFIQLMINLYRVKHRAGKMTPKNIYKKLERLDYISDKKWLLDKLKELE